MNRDLRREVDIFDGKKIEVPLLVYQHADSIDETSKAYTDFRGVKWFEYAGHWV